MTDLQDELRDAERAVYARPDIGETEADRAAAVERLTSLREKIREHEAADAAQAEIVAARDTVEPDTPPANHAEQDPPVGRRFRGRSRWIAVALVAAAAVVASWLVVLGIPQPSSLEIFDRPQTAEERDLTVPGAAGSIDYDSIRILVIGSDWEAFAYKLDNGDICVTLIDSDTASGGCINSDQFAATGIEMSTSSFSGPDATAGINLQWGPLGPPEVSFPDPDTGP